jgi:nucleotide-binding universal stress UspA family protein
MFENIIIATDLSENSRGALWAGINFARIFDSQITLLYVNTRKGFYPTELDSDPEFRRELERLLPTNIYEKNRKEIITGTAVAPTILEYAAKNQCDLLVAGSHGQTAIGNLLLGSVTQRLIRNTDIPVMVVHQFSPSGGQSNFSRIAVPTDFSTPAKKATELGVRLQKVTSGELHYLHVVDLPGIEEIHAHYLGEKLNMNEVGTVDVLLRECMEEFEPSGEVHFAKLDGDPPEEILNYCTEKDIDLLIMGTHGRKGLDRLLMGSVTASLISKAKCPVITVAVKS